jgi:hypothetical protein
MKKLKHQSCPFKNAECSLREWASGKQNKSFDIGQLSEFQADCLFY